VAGSSRLVGSSGGSLADAITRGGLEVPDEPRVLAEGVVVDADEGEGDDVLPLGVGARQRVGIEAAAIYLLDDPATVADSNELPWFGVCPRSP
jgi:hypothetical protein